jgi:hypothetical protein
MKNRRILLRNLRAQVLVCGPQKHFRRLERIHHHRGPENKEMAGRGSDGKNRRLSTLTVAGVVDAVDSEDAADENKHNVATAFEPESNESTAGPSERATSSRGGGTLNGEVT